MLPEDCTQISPPPFASIPQRRLHFNLFQEAFSLFVKRFICKDRCDGKCSAQEPEFYNKPGANKLGKMEDQFTLNILEEIANIWWTTSGDGNGSKASSMPLDKYGLIGDMLGTVLSIPVLTYFFAPIFTLMEFEVLWRVRKLAGFKVPESGDGVFVPGAGFGTITALRLALHKTYNGVKQRGILEGTDNQIPCLFHSECSKEVVRKAADVCGIEQSSCILIPNGKSTGGMDVDKLRDSIEVALAAGLSPFLIVASLGSQNSPEAFDPLKEIAEIAQQYGLWLHVDGSFGGPVLFSDRLKDELLRGIDGADSVLFGMESLLGSPHCTTLLVSPHPNICLQSLGLNDTVLYEKSASLYDPSFDRGDGSLQTCRRPDVVKIWMMWKVHGASGLGRIAERSLARRKEEFNQFENTREIDKETSPALNESSGGMTDCQLFKTVFGLIQQNSLYFEDKRDEIPAVKFRNPKVLAQEFDFSLQDEGIHDSKEVLEIIRKILDYSNKIPHPHLAFQLLCGGLDPLGVIGDFLSAFTSCSMESEKESFVYGKMELELFAEVRRLVGYSHSEATEGGYGLICPGGSVSIISAMYIAQKLLHKQSSGNNLQLVVYISRNTHYCFKKGCILLGIGLDNCIVVDVDEEGKMRPDLLRKAICHTLSEKKTPFFVAATAGTTILGCFDDIPRISEICQEFGCWFHVDGSFGGSFLFSEKYKELYLKGVEKCDSFNWNPHKWLGIPQECSILVLKAAGSVQKAFGDFGHGDEFGMSSGLQWGRRQNVFKFWLNWKAQGGGGWERWKQHVEYTMELKDFLVRELRECRKESFRIWKDDFELPGVLFQYIPRCLRGEDIGSQAIQEKLGKVTGILSSKLVLEGVMAIGVYRDNGSVALLRMTLMNSGITKEDVLRMLDRIDKYGERIVL